MSARILVVIGSLLLWAAPAAAQGAPAQQPPAEETGGLTPEQRALQEMAATQETPAPAAQSQAAAQPKDSGVRQTFGEYLSYLVSQVRLSGYGEVRMQKKTDDTPLLFEQHKLALVVSSRLSDWAYVESELEYETNGNEVKAEYIIVDFEIRKWLMLRTGLMLVPFGQFNEIWHPSFRNRFIERPLVYQETFPATYADAGIQLRGVFDIGPHDLGYALYVVNGLRSPESNDSGSLRDMRELTLDPTSSHKGFGARVWTALDLGDGAKLTAGASVYAGPHASDPVRWLTIVGADVLLEWNSFEFLGEWAAAIQERASGPSLKKNGAYAQVAYTLFDFIQPAVRFDVQVFPGSQDDVWQLVPALNFIILDGVIWKTNYYLTRTLDGPDIHPDEFITELAFSF